MAKGPWHVWVVGIVGLLWNCGGAYNYLSIKMWPETAQPNFPEEIWEYYTNFPFFMDLTWALSVWGGVLGCILLLVKRSWAPIVFLVSLVSMVIHFGWSLLGPDGPQYDAGGNAFSVLIIVVAAFLLFYARRINQESA